MQVWSYSDEYLPSYINIQYVLCYKSITYRNIIMQVAISLSHLSHIKHTTAISIDTKIMIILYISSKISTRQNR